MRSEAIESRLAAAGWTRQVAGDRDFDAAVRAIVAAMDSGKGMIVSGEYGVGKTSLLNAIVPKSVFRVSLAISTERLTEEWQRYWAENPFERSVLLDDLGAEPVANDYGIRRSVVGDFIVRWHHYHRPPNRLFISTNLHDAEFDDTYGGRVYSRIKDLCVPLTLTGKDKRTWTL